MSGQGLVDTAQLAYHFEKAGHLKKATELYVACGKALRVGGSANLEVCCVSVEVNHGARSPCIHNLKVILDYCSGYDGDTRRYPMTIPNEIRSTNRTPPTKPPSSPIYWHIARSV